MNALGCKEVAEMAAQANVAPIIIKKKKGGKGGGHHGGAWKVAMADFALAMMALFLVLWVINSSNEQEREAISGYFQDPKAFEEGNRLELAEQEREEISVITEFLPKPLGEDDLKQACAQVVHEVGADGLRDMGRCMNVLKEKFPGRMDFGKASGIVKGMLR